jgi:hypothetical protein
MSNFKAVKTDTTTVTRDLREFEVATGKHSPFLYVSQPKW